MSQQLPGTILLSTDGQILAEFVDNSLKRREIIMMGGRIFLWRGDDQRDGKWYRIYRETDVHHVGAPPSGVSSISAIDPADIERYIELSAIIVDECPKKPMTMLHLDTVKERLALGTKIMEDIISVYKRSHP